MAAISPETAVALFTKNRKLGPKNPQARKPMEWLSHPLTQTIVGVATTAWCAAMFQLVRTIGRHTQNLVRLDERFTALEKTVSEHKKETKESFEHVAEKLDLLLG